MPDPRITSYLPKPAPLLLPALRACWPPEFYDGAELNAEGDLYFLGLTLYFFLTRHFPYPLERGWPTNAILRGEFIPVTVFQPELSPDLVRLITDLLSPAPDRRPSAATVRAWWDHFTKGCLHHQKRTPYYLATPVEIEENLRQKRTYLRGKRIKDSYRVFRSPLRWVFPLGFTICLFFIFMVRREVLPPDVHPPDPAVAVRGFYQQFAQGKQGGWAESPHTSPEVFMDFLSAWEERRQMAEDLLNRPLFEVRALIRVEEGEEGRKEEPSQVLFQAELVWWEWTDTGWTERLSRERLRLLQKDKGWQVIERVGTLPAER